MLWLLPTSETRPENRVFYVFLFCSRYLPGVMPSSFLNDLIKFCEFLYFNFSEISLTGISVSASQFFAM